MNKAKRQGVNVDAYGRTSSWKAAYALEQSDTAHRKDEARQCTPRVARVRFSVMNCLRRRPLPAPRLTRTAISDRLFVLLASKRYARFAHAISKTSERPQPSLDLKLWPHISREVVLKWNEMHRDFR